jgi:methyl-accepting chemotaxis protein
MFSRLKLGTKIAAGFAVVLVLTAVVGYVGISSLGGVVEITDKAGGADALIAKASEARIQVLYYLDKESDEYARGEDEILQDIVRRCDELEARMNEQADREAVASARDAAQAYDSHFKTMVDLTGQQHDREQAMLASVGSFTEAFDRLADDLQSRADAAQKAARERTREVLRRAQQAGEYIVDAQAIRLEVFLFLSNKKPEHARQAKEILTATLARARKEADATDDPTERSHLERIASAVATYSSVANGLIEATHAGDQARVDELLPKGGVAGKAIIGSAHSLRDHLQGVYAEVVRTSDEENADSQWKLRAAGELTKLFGAAGAARRDYMRTGEMAYLKSNRESMKRFFDLCDQLAGRFERIEDRQQVEAVKASGQRYADALGAWADLEDQKDREYARLADAAGTFVATCARLSDGQQAKKASTITSSNAMMLAGSGAAVLLGVGLAAFITRSITKPINEIIEGLRSGSQQTASASGQVAAASQSLAEGASEQAASIEETTASVEEMSSMTRNNASNARQADEQMTEAGKVVTRGQESMGELARAIDQIKASSDETAKIVKTIDEIAFQTNLLALNAAVEAARAGEAGKGFAVVAEEVRNLAQRSAEAARNTSDLIEQSVRNAEQGVSVTRQCSEAFQAVTDSSTKVAQLVNEIASASEEQAQGIDQINTAVTQMDQVTQKNAANAEESASASEELSAQAEELNGMVARLELLVRGVSADRDTQATPGYRADARANGSSEHAPHCPSQSARTSAGRDAYPTAAQDAVEADRSISPAQF